MKKEFINEINHYRNLMGLEPLNETNINKKILSEDFSYIANDSKGTITSNYGYRIHPVSGKRKKHAGIDIAHPTGTEVLAMTDGVVIESDMAVPGCGGTIAVDHGDINGKKIKTRFCHNSKLLKNIGDQVKKGDVIAISGGGKNDPGRGTSTGSHIHFEVYENGTTVDPKPYYNGTVKSEKSTPKNLESEVAKNARLCGWGNDVDGYKNSGWKCPKPGTQKTEPQKSTGDILKQPAGDPYEYKKTTDGKYYTKKRTSSSWIDITGTKFETPIRQKVFKDL